jgi:hypothetical protein
MMRVLLALGLGDGGGKGNGGNGVCAESREAACGADVDFELYG